MKRNGNKTHQRKATAVSKPKSKVIGFRLAEADLALLVERATEEGRSVCQMAGDLVVAALHNDNGADAKEALERMEKMDDRIAKVREDLALATEVLLANAGKRSASDAAEWVDSNLKSESTDE